MEQQQIQGRDVDYLNRILQHLLEQYLGREALPNQAAPISITLVHQIYRHVIAEGYGQ
jgi:hypothetical protein